jgi:hypothetical protein
MSDCLSGTSGIVPAKSIETVRFMADEDRWRMHGHQFPAYGFRYRHPTQEQSSNGTALEEVNEGTLRLGRSEIADQQVQGMFT